MTSQLRQNILLSLLVTALGATINVFNTVVDHMALGIGMEALAMGLLISTRSLGSLTGVVLTSAFADRLGKRRFIIASLLVLAIGCAVLAMDAGPAALHLGLFCLGFGFSPSEALSSALLTDENPGKGSLWMNISQAGFSIGAIVGPLLTMAYLRHYTSYHGAFLLTGLLPLLFLLLLVLTGRGRFKPGPRENKVSLNMFSVFLDRRFVMLALTIFLYIGYESVAPPYIKQAFLQAGQDETMAAMMISLFWGIMVVSRLLGALFAGKEFMSIRAFTVITALGFLLIVLARSAFLRVLAVALIGFGCGPVWPMLIELAARQFPERTGAAVGMMMLCCMLGFIVFPPLIGTLPGNLAVTFVICAVLACLVILVVSGVLREERKAAG